LFKAYAEKDFSLFGGEEKMKRSTLLFTQSAALFILSLASCQSGASSNSEEKSLVNSSSADSGSTAQKAEISSSLQQATIDSLVFQDALGRISNEKKLEDSTKHVGIFYHIWHGVHTPGIYNVSELNESHPRQLWSPASSEVSPNNVMYYWGKPLYDYYSSDDPWVIERHMELLTMSGIDYIALDESNLLLYEDTLKLVLEKVLELQSQGWNPPKVVLMFGENAACHDNIFKFYKMFFQEANGRYDKAWYAPNGKPVIAIGMYKSGDFSDDYLDMKAQGLDQVFEIRNMTFPYSFDGPDERFQGPEGMPWIDWGYPQCISDAGYMSVSVAQHPSYAMSSSVSPAMKEEYYDKNWGRGYDFETKKNDPNRVLEGANLEQQWHTAFANYDQVKEVMVTGFNEWIATKLVDYPGKDGSFTGKVCFVDQCNMEFSRDIEMMSGGYGDNFYLQNMRNVRAFKDRNDRLFIGKKGVGDPSAAEWEGGRSYLDIAGDAMERNHRNAAISSSDVGYAILTNKTNRNDIVKSEMIDDGEYLYLRVTTKDDIIIDDEKENNLNVLFRVQGSGAASWNGFQYLLNRKLKQGATRTSLERLSQEGQYEWGGEKEVECAITGKTFFAKIPLEALGVKGKKDFTIDFKVADGISNSGDIMQYYVDGDVAPIGRLAYRYHAGESL
jgi:hypothetical protein